MKFSEMLLEEARKDGLRESKNYEKDNENKVFVGYSYWDTEYARVLRINTEIDAEPIAYMLQREVPFVKMEEFYIDTYEQWRVEQKCVELDALMEKCKTGKYDIIVCPSLFSFGRCYVEISDRIKELAALKKPVYVYFIAENIYTGDVDAKERFEMHALLDDYFRRIEERKSKIRENIYIGMKHYKEQADVK